MADQVTLVAGFREGELLGGKYRIERVLGAGGMGIVVARPRSPVPERR
jgi:hypothetical protein